MNKLAEIIVRQIRAAGPIPFPEFMELALYCPVYGYYEKEEDKIGRCGDFYTSVSAGPVFGRLLAHRFAKWLKTVMGTDSKPDTHLALVEAGAHRGALAADILCWLKAHDPGLMAQLEYVILEPSVRLGEMQQERLREFPRVRWEPNWAALSTSHPNGIHGVIFSNELLDAMPVHRLGWDAAQQAWFEWGVDFADSRFVGVRLAGAPPADALPGGIPPQLLSVLPDGFTIETGPAAATWCRKAARSLARGVLLTCDYGLDFRDFFEPGRHSGTLRSYHGHHVSADVLSNPGEQDITAHVNFDALRAAGEAEGLRTLGYCTQAEFLTEIARDLWSGPGPGNSWTPEGRRQFQVLTHPEHFGRAFRVLLQAREFPVE